MLREATLLVLMLSFTAVSAQEKSSADVKWTDKNSTEQYAAYLISNAYAESGHCIAAVNIKNVGGLSDFTVDPGPLCMVRSVDVLGPRILKQSVVLDGGPKVGEVYSADRLNDFVRDVKNRYAMERGPLTDVTWSMRLDRERAQVSLQLEFTERQ
jgi:hypothetical protein